MRGIRLDEDLEHDALVFDPGIGRIDQLLQVKGGSHAHNEEKEAKAYGERNELAEAPVVLLVVEDVRDDAADDAALLVDVLRH